MSGQPDVRAQIVVIIAVLFSAHAASQAPSLGASPFETLRAAAQSELRDYGAPGAAVAVVDKGEIVYAEGFGVADRTTGAAATPDTVFQIGSLTKMMTAAAVVSLARDGRLSLEAPVGAVVAGLAPPIAALTPHQLLSQTSGLRDEPGESGPSEEEALEHGMRALSDADRLLAPGRVFSYSNLGYALAGLAGARAAQTSYADLMRAQIFAPRGMTRSTLRLSEVAAANLARGHRKGATGFEAIAPSANTRLGPAGYAFSTANDVARFVIALVGGGERPFPEAVRRALFTRHAPMPNIFEDGAYGYGLMLYDFRGVAIAEHGGTTPGYTGFMRIAPEARFAVIVLANGDAGPFRRTAEAAMALRLPLQPPAVAAAEPHLPMNANEMSALAGEYTNRGVFRLTVEDNALVLRQNDGPPRPVRKVGPTRYVAGAPGQPGLRFVLEPASSSSPAYLHFALWAFVKRDDSTKPQ